jgi:hypothetical protein
MANPSPFGCVSHCSTLRQFPDCSNHIPSQSRRRTILIYHRQTAWSRNIIQLPDLQRRDIPRAQGIRQALLGSTARPRNASFGFTKYQAFPRDHANRRCYCLYVLSLPCVSALSPPSSPELASSDPQEPPHSSFATQSHDIA